MDTTHKCKDCGNDFVITAGEMKFFNEVAKREGRDPTPPKRCKDCRILKRERNEKQQARQEASVSSNWGSDKEMMNDHGHN